MITAFINYGNFDLHRGLLSSEPKGPEALLTKRMLDDYVYYKHKRTYKEDETMSIIAINEEMHLEKEWFKEAGECTVETLPAFVDHIMKDYIHDYGTACHAVAACAIAAAWAACKKEGLTGFQAGFVMWDFVREWSYSSNKCGLSIINWDNLLYPQYEHIFRGMEIPESVWHKVVEEAQNRLKERDYAADHVVDHWRSIADGHLPFGCRIRKDD